jgi:hypothetical protein
MPDSEMWMGPGLARVCILLMFGVKPSFRFWKSLQQFIILQPDFVIISRWRHFAKFRIYPKMYRWIFDMLKKFRGIKFCNHFSKHRKFSHIFAIIRSSVRLYVL